MIALCLGAPRENLEGIAGPRVVMMMSWREDVSVFMLSRVCGVIEQGVVNTRSQGQQMDVTVGPCWITQIRNESNKQHYYDLIYATFFLSNESTW
jgi:hypothetical protein